LLRDRQPALLQLVLLPGSVSTVLLLILILKHNGTSSTYVGYMSIHLSMITKTKTTDEIGTTIHTDLLVLLLELDLFNQLITCHSAAIPGTNRPTYMMALSGKTQEFYPHVLTRLLFPLLFLLPPFVVLLIPSMLLQIHPQECGYQATMGLCMCSL